MSWQGSRWIKSTQDLKTRNQSKIQKLGMQRSREGRKRRHCRSLIFIKRCVYKMQSTRIPKRISLETLNPRKSAAAAVSLFSVSTSHDSFSYLYSPLAKSEPGWLSLFFLLHVLLHRALDACQTQPDQITHLSNPCVTQGSCSCRPTR
jgi:hypothetical protein